MVSLEKFEKRKVDENYLDARVAAAALHLNLL